MGLRRLLVATDFSARSELALRRAASLSNQFGAELDLLHVVDDDQPAQIVEQEIQQARSLLRVTASELRDRAGREAAAVVRSGDPFQEIVDAAAGNDVDLIVMGSHRRQILRDVFVGTTIERVIRTGHHPVLMVNNPTDESYRRVIVATDLSPASANSLGTARALGLLDGAHVSLLHAFEPMAKSMMIYANIEREKIEAHVAREGAEAQQRLYDLVDEFRLDELQYDLRLIEGPTFRVIKGFVDQEQPDLLVIGTRGLTGVMRVLLGSVADAILRGVECDVLAVPPVET